MSRLVILTKDGWPFCSGLRISRRQVLTAKHCLFEPHLGRPLDHTLSLLGQSENNRIEAYFLDDLNASHRLRRIDSSLQPSSEIRVRDDHLVLALATPGSQLTDPDDVSVLVAGESAVIHEPALLIGYYAFHNPAWRFQLAGNQLRTWQDGLRLTRGSYCRIFDKSKNDHCLAHGCQSMVLFSGGPLLSLDPALPDGVVKLLGVHSRSGTEAKSCAPFEVSSAWHESAVGSQGGIAVSGTSID